MKNLLFILAISLSFNIYAQKEGQDFCAGDPTEGYFFLCHSTKYIIWGDTYYVEALIGDKELNNELYKEYTQSWESGDVVTLHVREENGVTYQLDKCCNKDSVRLPKDPKLGDLWKTIDGSAEYEIITLEGELKTPLCNYKDLLVLKSTFENGIFTFYYQKGYGYIGATVDNELISFVVPRLPEELMKEQKD